MAAANKNQGNSRFDNFKNIDKKLKHLKPTKKHIAIIEAKRIQNAMHEVIDNAKMALLLATHCNTEEAIEPIEEEYNDKRLESILKLHNDVTRNILKEQRNYQTSSREVNKDSVFKASLLKVIKNYKERDTSKTLGRKVWSDSASLFIQYLKEVCKIIRDNLLTSQEEEYRKVLYVGEVLKRSRKSHDMIVFKKRQLEERLYENKNEISVLDSKLNSLNQELENAKKDAEEDHERILSDACQQIHTENKHLENNSKDVKDEIMKLRETLQSNRKEHFEHETVLRKKRYKLTTELHNWITKYDEDLEWRQEEIEEIIKEQEINQSDLKTIETHFAKLEVEYEEIMKKREAKAEVERKKLVDMGRKVKAAIRIQEHWKTYVLRQILAGRTVGAGKKGKGKKRKGIKK